MESAAGTPGNPVKLPPTGFIPLSEGYFHDVCLPQNACSSIAAESDCFSTLRQKFNGKHVSRFAPFMCTWDSTFMQAPRCIQVHTFL